MTWKPYKIKPNKQVPMPRPPSLRPPGKADEGLTGFIGTMEASDIEERSDRAQKKLKVNFGFRVQFAPGDPPQVIYGRGGRDQLGNVEADFFGAWSGSLLAVQNDGEFAHKTAAQREKDRRKDAVLRNILYQLGGGTLVRIPHYYLETQEQADNTWRQVLNGRTEFA